MKNNSKYSNRLSACFIGILIVLSIIIFVLYSNTLSNGILKGIKFCIEIIVPSLFPFMILSSFAVTSGIAEKIGKIISPVTERIFKLPGSAGIAIIIGLIGGYPTGAKITAQLYENRLITKTQAEHMSMFCICSGPGFAITAVGLRMMNNIQVGVILFASQVIAVLLLGIISGLFAKKESSTIEVQRTNINTVNAFIDSVNTGISSIINMSGLVVLFSGLIELLTESDFLAVIQGLSENLNISPAILQSISVCLLEITAGSKLACSLHSPFELISFALSFAGLCIHFQIFSILPLHINKLKFFIFRIMSGLISAFSTYILLKFFPQAQETFFSNVQALSYDTTQSYIGMISLIIMSIAFLLSINQLTGNKGNTAQL